MYSEEEGIHRERIVTDKDCVLNQFFCPICYCLLWKPRSCASCQNLFCTKCIQTWLDTNSTVCPFCRLPYEERRAPPYVQSLLSHFSIRCRNFSFGCTEILSYDGLEKHENVECKFSTKKCCVCEQLVLTTEIDDHKNICKPTTIQCPLCESSIAIELFEDHKNECSQEYSDPDELVNQEWLMELNSQTLRINPVGLEMLNQIHENSYVIRFWTIFQLILFDMSMAHLILFKLIRCGMGSLTTSFLYLKTLIRLSIYQAFIFIIVFSIILSYGLSFLLESISDMYIIVFIIFSLIILGSINSHMQLNQSQMSFNLNETLLYSLFIYLLFKIPLLTMRFYFEHIPINIGTGCLASAIICYM